MTKIHVLNGCEASLGVNCPAKSFLFDRIRHLSAQEAEYAEKAEQNPDRYVLKEAEIECLGKDAVGQCMRFESEAELIDLEASDVAETA